MRKPHKTPLSLSHQAQAANLYRVLSESVSASYADQTRDRGLIWKPYNSLGIAYKKKAELTMSFASQSTQQTLRFPYDDVFDWVVAVRPTIGFNLKSQDRAIGRITASTGMSLFSWGENLTIVAEKVDDSSTLIGIESALKVGINVADAHRHVKNFHRLIERLSWYLQSRGRGKSNA